MLKNKNQIILKISDKESVMNDIEKLRKKISFDDVEFVYDSDNSELMVTLNSIDLKVFESLISSLDNIEVFNELLSRIQQIKSYGLNNGKRIYQNYNDERKVLNRKQKSSDRNKFYYASGHTFSPKNNEMPSQFINQIVCADSKKFLQKLPDNSIDLIFTSPPYNFGLQYTNNEDASHWKDYFDKLFEIFDECIRVLKFGGRFIVNIQPLFSDYIPSHHVISNYFMSKKLLWKGEILWEKNNYNCKYTAWGSWKSPSSPYLKYTWEFLEVFTKGTLLKKGDKSKIDITADEFKEFVVAKWSLAPERKMKDYGHPAMFPEKLVERALKLFSFQDDIILDPFNGVGTTTYVAKMLQRKYLGVDISPEYTKKAIQRIHEGKELKSQISPKKPSKSLKSIKIEKIDLFSDELK
jgi:DNA modification methylase